MNDIHEFFEVEKKFSGYEKGIAGIVTLYYFMIYIFGEYDSGIEIVLAACSSVVLLIDYAIGMKKYWENKYIFMVLKQLLLFATALSMVCNSGIYLSVILMSFLYVAVIIQYLFVYDIVERYYRVTAIIMTLFPLNAVSFGYYILYGKTNFEILLVMVFVTVCTTIFASALNVVSGSINKITNEMFRRERIAINSHKEYENLKVYQSKLVHANEQLSVQKFQMERLNERINNRNRQMDLQYRILKHITGSTDVGKLTKFITDEIIDNMKVDLCIIIVCDTGEGGKEFGNIKYTEISRLTDKTMNLFKNQMEKTYVGGEYIIDNDVEPGKYYFLDDSGIISLLIYPVNISEKDHGMMVVGSCAANYFTAANMVFYNGIVEQIVLAVNNASMYRAVQEMAEKDPLTRIFNRRYFNTIYGEYVENVKKNNKPLTIILFDIDKFKAVNDSYGHLFGDEVISFCGKTAGDTAAANDGVAVRYGGEEFVIVFPDKNVQEVLGIVEKMHEQVRKHEFLYEDMSVYINVSIGISSYPETCEDLSELLNRADLAMYHSKNTGRGRITIDGS